jgi:F plasmid transfer operon protein TraF
VTMPAAGLSYYRLRSTFVGPALQPAAATNHVESLVTHHAGATLVHSLFGQVAVGATVKFVRGLASEGVAGGDAEEPLDDWDLIGVSTNRFDVDVGVMATGNLVRGGVTFRNLTEPGFRTQSNTELHLDRQVRAGVALVLTRQWTAAADFDLTRNSGPFGDVRSLAFGTEGRLTPRAVVRTGVQFNMAGSERTPTANVGGTYAVFGSLLVDAHFSTGSDRAFRGWGVAGRMLF